MAGLYVHIPFCKSRCIYCGFYSTTHVELRQRYVDALVAEMCWHRGNAQGAVAAAVGRTSATEPVTTVYLGGGTPSQLTFSQLEQLFTAIDSHFDCQWAGAEVTVECNPDDVSDELARLLPTLRVNRVSMGVQTFSDARLRFLGRRHTAAQVHMAVDRLREAGIANISVDLMYGFPGECLEDWQHDIDRVLSLEAEHLSAYALSYEEGTPLFSLWQKSPGRYGPASDELQSMMYDVLVDRLAAAGYEHYEISNFAKPGHRSRHNSSYWTGVHYTGLGASAHSYDGHYRQWNVSDLKQYMLGQEQGQPLIERELIDTTTRYNETVMLSLRTREGLRLDLLDDEKRRYCETHAQRFVDNGLLAHSQKRLIITRRGLFVSDMIISELMMV